MSKDPFPLNTETLEALDQLTDRRRERLVEVAGRRRKGLMVLMEDVHNPHNLMAIARSCDAFGLQDVAFTLENPDLFNPRSIGKLSSATASKWLDWRIFDEGGTARALQTLKAEGWTVLATVAETDDTQVLYDVDLASIPKLIVMVGNEHAGLSPAALAGADLHVTIPMEGMIRSLNVSVATAIVLAEVTRQRRAAGRDERISAEDANSLLQRLVERTV